MTLKSIAQKETVSLNYEQKQAVGLLTVGTFLEYFDLMLYVHMAVLLNELFFPETDPYSASIIAAFSFCSTFLFRPFGALIFGYIGDNFGRKHTVVITTFLMSASCLIMASLPTYAEIGITATVLITLCRILQGMSSMGEKVGAELYLTESISRPLCYPIVALVNVSSALGASVALGIASIFAVYSLNWRMAFWFGAGVALIGAMARTALRETPEFVNAKYRIEKSIKEIGESTEILEKNPIWLEKVPIKTTVAYFLLQCSRPTMFYFIYVHCSIILKNTFDYTAEQIITHNLIVSSVDLLGAFFITYLSYKIYPLKIIKTIIVIFTVALFCTSYLLPRITDPIQLLLLQCFFCLITIDTAPGTPIFLAHLPIFKRFTYSSFLYALSRALMYFVTAFGFVYFTDKYSGLGLLIIMIPIIIGFSYGLSHFEKLEKEGGHFR